MPLPQSQCPFPSTRLAPMMGLQHGPAENMVGRSVVSARGAVVAPSVFSSQTRPVVFQPQREQDGGLRSDYDRTQISYVLPSIPIGKSLWRIPHWRQGLKRTTSAEIYLCQCQNLSIFGLKGSQPHCLGSAILDCGRPRSSILC